MNMGLFYGSSTCYTEMAAEKIRDIIGPELVTLHNLKDNSPKLMEQYDVLILGIPTWDLVKSRKLGSHLDQLDDLNLEGKIIALYGLGDQLGYGEWFLDALGMLHDKLSTKGVKFVGYWPTEGYEFTSPKPVIADGQLFVQVWRWMKLTSMTLATSVFRAGASKSSTKWQSITPDLTDGLAHMLCRHLIFASLVATNPHNTAIRLRQCCRLPAINVAGLPPSERKRSIMPLLIIHGALTMLHSCPCQRKRPSINDEFPGEH